jgi:hypothetical protein
VLVYIARRIVYVIPIVISVALVCFLLVHITPGDPLVAVLPADASQELAAQLRIAYGFDRPLPVQFGIGCGRRSMAMAPHRHPTPGAFSAAPSARLVDHSDAAARSA